ncbi:MAG TPA: 16S rRNA (cytosine(1402)-N(4))-methyltransferase RsmH [Candidatus Paceibacterota bacterium]|nr:16S rRNA (cytosine(1402)-N(4))-methyltransferase RsmH [Candidatus Paceibacterota bacterium]
MHDSLHKSVLLQEAVDGLRIERGDTVVDATVGGAGHFLALLDALNGTGTLIGIDADEDAIVRGEHAASTSSATEVHLVNDNFRNLGAILDRLGVETVSKVLFDLGWSAYHLTAGRGFSFQKEEPLLMTYGEPKEGTTAADLINTAPEEKLSEILFTLGEERFARQIARGIVETRSRSRILTTGQLVDVITKSTPSWYQHRRIHPATKTFQALRIAVNDELGAVRDGLTAAIERLSEGGRVAVITFHSIEDRVVKSMLRDAAYAGKGTVITKKPIAPSEFETKENPRARSAKLRIFERSSSDSPVNKILTAYAFA